MMKPVGKYRQDEYAGEAVEHSEGILPPGIDKVEKDNLGELVLSIGELSWLNSVTSYDHILFKPIFWGEKEPKFMLRAKNTSEDQQGVIHYEARYQIR